MRISNKNGFTLIELIIVIAIFAIGSAIALPSLMEMGRRDQVKTEARQLKDQLAWGRATAIEQNTPVVVTLGTTNYTVGSTTINLTKASMVAVVTDSANNSLTTFQWNARGYPTTVGGNSGDIKSITITCTGSSKSLVVSISTAGDIAIN